MTQLGPGLAPSSAKLAATQPSCDQVMVSPGLEDIKGASFNFDFSYERKVDREAAEAEAKDDARSSSGRLASALQVRDVYLPGTLTGFEGMQAVHAQAVLDTDGLFWLSRWRILGRKRSSSTQRWDSPGKRCAWRWLRWALPLTRMIR